MGLPTGYTEVQYIQSTGTQYADTEFKPTGKTKIICDFVAYNQTTTQQGIFGSRPGTTNRFTLFTGLSTGTLQADYNTGESLAGVSTGISGLDLTQRVIVGMSNALTINGKIVNTISQINFTASYNLYLFANNNAGTVQLPASIKLYSCKIYDDDALIRNYIPCINPDGEAGLYDTVNSKFYGNTGTGVFFAGPPKVTLPSAYTQLEYILSSGTQIIDTGVTPGNTTKVEIDFEPTSLDAHHLMILGTRNTSSGGNQFVIGWTGHKSPAVWRSDYGSSQVNFTTAITGAARHHAVKNAASCKIDTETVANTAATFTSSYTLYLFGGNQANTAVSQITAKLYRCKIYTSNQLVRDLIPCMNAAGAIGLYDLVSSKFYANAGTGVFTAGPEVTWPSDDAIYVKVNGIWRQIDGIKLL